MINSISIIFPIYNEEKRLNSSFNHIISYIKKKKIFKIELIFVDDGSTDKSSFKIKQFLKNYNKFLRLKKIKTQFLISKKNLGKGSALKKGAIKARHDWILTADIDMSVPLAQLNMWVTKKLINKDYYVYFASRSHNKSKIQAKFYRKVMGIIFRVFAFLILGISIKDTQCGFKLYKKSLSKLIFSKLKNYGFVHDLELILLLNSQNIKIKELPVIWKHKSNSRLNIFIDSVIMFIGIFLIRFRHKKYT